MKRYYSPLSPVRVQSFLATTPLSSHERLVFIAKYSDDSVNQRINRRAELLAEMLSAADATGKVRIVEHSIDCDHCSGRYVHTLTAPSLLQYERLYWDVSRGAEGPFTLDVLRAGEELEPFHSRDYIMEAHEDGHPHYVTY